MGFSLNQAFGCRFSVLLVAIFLATSGANGATLNVIEGRLMGASGVAVGGNLYDVQFLRGSCTGLFGGCNDPSDFTFTNENDSQSASLALLREVFVDSLAGNFDSRPGLTNGCQQVLDAPCSVTTPYSLAPTVTGGTVFGAFAYNVPRFAGDPDGDMIGPSFPGVNDELVYAVWTPVPEPGSALLIGLGLAGLSGLQRKRT